MTKLIQTINSLSSTNYRILVSTLGYLAILVAVLGFHQTPPTELYVFVATWAGLDTAQFISKRMTYKTDLEAE